MNGERLDLKTPPKEDLDEGVWHLNNKHDKEELEKMAKALRPILKDKLVMCRRSNGKEEVCDDVIPLLTDNNRKQSTAKAIAFMVTELSNLQLYIDSLSKEMKELWSEILISLYMSERTAQEILNTKEPIFSANSSWSYYTRTFVQKGFEFFCTVRSFQASMDGNYYRKYETFISVNPIF